VHFPHWLRFAALYFTSFLYLNKQGKYRSSRRTCGFFGKSRQATLPIHLAAFLMLVEIRAPVRKLVTTGDR
jgi:hypothetical protein